MPVFSACLGCMRTYFSSSFSLFFTLAVLYMSTWRVLVLRFWSSTTNLMTLVPTCTLIFNRALFLMSTSSLPILHFSSEISMANLMRDSFLKLFYPLSFPFLLMPTLLSCSSKRTLCPFFCLKSTTNPISFSVTESFQFVLFSSVPLAPLKN